MRYGNWTREETRQLLDRLGGVEVARLMLERLRALPSLGNEPPKYPHFTEGQVEALFNTLGEATVEAILAGDVKVTIEQIIRALVDATSRCIPLPSLKGEHMDANRSFHLVQPEINYTATLARLEQFFAPGMKFASAEDFQRQAASLIARIREDKQVANLLKGVYLPIVVPQIAVADYGCTLEETCLAAVERAYKAQFSDRTFNNYRNGQLAGHVDVVAESRHQRLIAKMAEGPVVLIHFPNPLQGFSIPGDRKMASALPEGFMLAGALDTAVSVVAHTATLCRDWNTPGLDCAANSWQGFSLYFEANGDKLRFDYRHLDAFDYYSGGLSFVG